ncbi:MAG TPA: O-antigen ligase family protein [Oligoflexus sp.]|uniref:O-antigen ligase family protein n=1 Tax=Oligoflexus sp. TaxID=1971216 RepID=UPI002D810F71|nr:O-antigen ligase family protein [Oligoflexus sp.]HET9238323.1 O-antigen ligase family protein [Oligoflexus sp.]
MNGRYQKPSMLPRAILILLGLALFLDIPAARAYNEHSAWTAKIGRLLFHGINEVYGIPLSFTLFEVLSYGLAGLIMIRWGTQRSRLWLILALSAFLVPLACAMGTVTGILRGNVLGLAFSQLHFVPMIPIWLVIGYYLGMQPIFLQKAVRILFWICIWRSVYALYVFLFVYGGRMGTREYLIDHASSGFLAMALGYAGFQAFTQRENLRRLWAYGAAFALMLWPYILNDRRTSFVGLMAALLLVPFILPKAIRLRLRSTFRLALAVAVVLVSYKVVFSKAPARLGQQEYGEEVVDVGNLDYRQIENYNLMIGVIERPLLGLGFGTRFPQAVPLPDISFSFELFDAIPHNTLLYLWTFAGPFGIAGLMTASCFMMLVLSRVGQLARSKRELLLAFLGLITVTQWGMYVSFDMGLLESRTSMLMGVFAGGLFPVYGRILLEQSYAKYQEHLRSGPAVQSEQPFGLPPSLQWQRPQAGAARTHI